MVNIHGYCLGTKRVSKGTSKQRRHGSRGVGNSDSASSRGASSGNGDGAAVEEWATEVH